MELSNSFYSKLVEETIASKEGENHQMIKVPSLEYRSEIKCYRLSLGTTSLDIPETSELLDIESFTYDSIAGEYYKVFSEENEFVKIVNHINKYESVLLFNYNKADDDYVIYFIDKKYSYLFFETELKKTA